MNIPYIEDFGGGVGALDNTPAFNAAAYAGYAIRFRDPYSLGQYRFRSEPDPINKSFAIYGALPNADGQTFIYRDYIPSSPTRGLFHWTTGQPYVNDVFISAISGNGGTGVSVIPAIGGTAGPGGLNHVRINASGGALDYCIYIDASNLTSPIGARTIKFSSVNTFGANVRSVLLKSIVHFNWSGGSVNQAGGVDGGLELTGTASAPSSENNINIDYITHNLTLSRFSNSSITVAEIAGTVLNDATVSGITGTGKILGAPPQTNWVDSSWRSGKTTYVSPT